MTEPAFNPGDVVRMKRIAGPHMTVERLRHERADSLVDTVWFDEGRHVQRDSFDAIAIEHVPEKEPRP